MNTLTTQQLWQQLQQQGLVTGDMPTLSEANSPWYVRVMLGVAGWIGALFLLGFISMALNDVINSSEASIICGLLACAVALAIFRWMNNDFSAQFALAVSMAGQGLFIFGMLEAFHSDTSMAGFIIFAFQALLAVFVPNSIHRVLTSWSAMLAFTFSLMSLGIYGVASGIIAVGVALINLYEQRWSAYDTILRPIGYGLVLALLQIDTVYFFIAELRNLWSSSPSEFIHAPLIGTSLVTLTLLWVVKHLLDKEAITLNSSIGRVAIIAALLLSVLSLFAHGMVTALLILLLGFATGKRILMGLGLLALFGFMSHYYYQLQHTLLFKSMVLAVSGLLLLSVRLGLQKYFPHSDKLIS